jgi:CelD/BcsL family acetyltransferase involved in cellulose biosynthesis
VNLVTILRTTSAVMIAPIIAWYLHILIGDALALFDLRAADWRFLLTSFYGYLFLGFVFAGVAAKLAPSRSRRFVRLTILASIVTGVILALASDYGVVAEVTIAFAVVVGAAGYGLRLRGFSEPLKAD